MSTRIASGRRSRPVVIQHLPFRPGPAEVCRGSFLEVMNKANPGSGLPSGASSPQAMASSAREPRSPYHNWNLVFYFFQQASCRLAGW